MDSEYLYRFNASVDFSNSDWHNPAAILYLKSTVDFYCEQFLITKKTPKGFWIVGYNGNKKFVLGVSDGIGKRFAYEKKEDAWQSFLLRKRKQKSILARQLKEVATILNNSKENLEELEYKTVGDGVQVKDFMEFI